MKDAVNFCRELLAFWADNIDQVIKHMKVEGFSDNQIEVSLAILCAEVPFGG